MFIRTKLARWLTFGFAAAITLFPFVLIAPGIRLKKSLVVHERIHLQQQAELLVIPFYLLYLLEYLLALAKGKSHFQAYRSISFEREAYQHERDSHYLRERKKWGWRYYL